MEITMIETLFERYYMIDKNIFYMLIKELDLHYNTRICNDNILLRLWYEELKKLDAEILKSAIELHLANKKNKSATLNSLKKAVESIKDKRIKKNYTMHKLEYSSNAFRPREN